jgi:adenylyltransferase/sulfurtransferase
MTRAGVGAVTVVDRDYVEESNLQRQSLYDESDARVGLPKAAAAEKRLRALNSDVDVRGIVADLGSDNADGFVKGQTLVLDGTDNFDTRFLLNDVCVRAGVPWVYGACVGSYGLALLVRPQVSPCLRCVLGATPAPGSGATCDTAGVVAPIVQVVAGIQAAEALKVLAGRTESVLKGLVSVDLWEGTFDVLDLSGRTPWCPACTEGKFEYAERARTTDVLCGRDAVQIRAGAGTTVDLAELAGRLRGIGEVTSNDFLVRFRARGAARGADLVVFRDGRAIVKGVKDAAEARTVLARYVG